ncbi:MAG TPA: hypothetical protein VNS22_01955 [Geminicoccus sp.]|uniref:hypothetical protein n=1 Tax=Geminicoccus sp. TaxID=2024832 RepID=UPI002B598F2E|nr:hypothetical protein [Geminicoccus sp.]HWL67127.1 hypothetical protein [Geminicoccus sp.]
MANLDFDVGKPGKRSWSWFKNNWDAIWEYLNTLPVPTEDQVGRVPRVNQFGDGFSLFGDPIDFRDDIVGGGRIKQVDMPAGNQTIPTSLTGVRLRSLSATAVTWTLPNVGATGYFFPWLQIGEGKITFAGPPGSLVTGGPVGFISSGGELASGIVECVDFSLEAGATWLVSGITGP